MGGGDDIACSIARMMSICTDKGKLIYAPKKNWWSQERAVLALLRVSDFLGLPPWLLLLTELFELKSAKFDEYPLMDFGRGVMDDASRYPNVEPPDSFFVLHKTVSSFRGEYSFFIELPIPTHTGAKKNAHVRLVQGIFPEFKSGRVVSRNHLWRSG